MSYKITTEAQRHIDTHGDIFVVCIIEPNVSWYREYTDAKKCFIDNFSGPYDSDDDVDYNRAHEPLETYKIASILSAAEHDYAWPISCGIIECVDDEEE